MPLKPPKAILFDLGHTISFKASYSSGNNAGVLFQCGRETSEADVKISPFEYALPQPRLRFPNIPVQE